MPRHLSTVHALTALTAFVTLSTASAEERGEPVAPQATPPAVVVTEKASPQAAPTYSDARMESVARTCGADAIGSVTPDGSIRCQSKPATLAQTGPRELLAGTYYVSIPAIACTPQGTAAAATTGQCSGGGTLRTDGDNLFPCTVNANATRNTFVCGLDLPNGAQIQEVIAYGLDYSTAGYFEAAIWSTGDTTFAPTYFSSFGGTWQSSGVAFNGGFTSFPIFSASQPAHTVTVGNRYTIGFGTRDPNASVNFYGFRARYFLP
ncbi:hypothetical protein [Myxococcus sp. AB025B]|uniref:hypothetical protein n=1 Tax=Myxococcus sp. AB025B TaxID=2562794 RepID=UPI001144AB92|nr:hypothetical protein [Myxococcus sp. AB025B]